MRGYQRFNFDAFDAARDILRRMGHNPISPADLDREVGFNPDDPTLTGFDLRDAIMRDVQAVMVSDAIVLLDGWERSRGVAVEKALAEFLDIPVLRLVDGQLVSL
jgi:hypothetical protein